MTAGTATYQISKKLKVNALSGPYTCTDALVCLHSLEKIVLLRGRN